MNANITDLKSGLIDKSEKRKEWKIGFLCKWNRKWNYTLLKSIFIIRFIKLKQTLAYSYVHFYRNFKILHWFIIVYKINNIENWTGHFWLII